jgi:hypothetical protein
LPDIPKASLKLDDALPDIPKACLTLDNTFPDIPKAYLKLDNAISDMLEYNIKLDNAFRNIPQANSKIANALRDQRGISISLKASVSVSIWPRFFLHAILPHLGSVRSTVIYVHDLTLEVCCKLIIRVTVGRYPLISESLAASAASAWNGGNIEWKRNEEWAFFVRSPALEGVLCSNEDALKG